MISLNTVSTIFQVQPLTPKPSTSAQASPPHEARLDSKQDKGTITPTTPAEQEDTISISIPSQEINHYIEAMAELPDLRKERITQIQAALKSGTYSVSSQNLADKIIQDLST